MALVARVDRRAVGDAQVRLVGVALLDQRLRLEARRGLEAAVGLDRREAPEGLDELLVLGHVGSRLPTRNAPPREPAHWRRRNARIAVAAERRAGAPRAPARAGRAGGRRTRRGRSGARPRRTAGRWRARSPGSRRRARGRAPPGRAWAARRSPSAGRSPRRRPPRGR